MNILLITIVSIWTVLGVMVVADHQHGLKFYNWKQKTVVILISGPAMYIVFTVLLLVWVFITIVDKVVILLENKGKLK